MSRRFDADPVRVFDAWLDPTVLGRWLFDVTGGGLVIDGEGNRLCVRRVCPGGETRVVGEYRELDRPRRLMFRFSGPDDARTRERAAVEFAPDGAGCRLSLIRFDTPADEIERSAHEWNRRFDRLALELNSRTANRWCR